MGCRWSGGGRVRRRPAVLVGFPGPVSPRCCRADDRVHPLSAGDVSGGQLFFQKHVLVLSKAASPLDHFSIEFSSQGSSPPRGEPWSFSPIRGGVDLPLLPRLLRRMGSLPLRTGAVHGRGVTVGAARARRRRRRLPGVARRRL